MSDPKNNSDKPNSIRGNIGDSDQGRRYIKESDQGRRERATNQGRLVEPPRRPMPPLEKPKP